MFDKSDITDVRVFNAFWDFLSDLNELFGKRDCELEPEYDDFVSCFDQGKSEKKILENYKFQNLDAFVDVSSNSVVGHGNIDWASKKMKKPQDTYVTTFTSILLIRLLFSTS